MYGISDVLLVFIIRYAERKIDQLLDAALLEYSPLSNEFDSIQFESEWSFLRSFGNKKKAANANGATVRSGTPSSPNLPSRPPSPSIAQVSTSPTNQRSFASLRQTLARGRAPSGTTPLQALFVDPVPSVPPPPSPKDITSFMTALHTLLTLSGINPALIIQLWSQVMYWTACKKVLPLLFQCSFGYICTGETFNRVLTRKKYLCRYVMIFTIFGLGMLR